MAGNTEKIDEIIDTGATTQQYKTLSEQLVSLEADFVRLVKQVNAFNRAAADAKGTAEFNKQVAQSAIAQEKLIDVQNRNAIASKKLEEAEAKLAITKNRLVTSANQAATSTQRAQAAQERAAAAAQKALSPYQQLSKQLDTMRASAKDVAVQFGLGSKEFEKAQKPVQELDEKLKKIDKTLGQNQRNVGNYEHDVKTALEFFSEKLNELVPGSGAITRNVVEGFLKIPEAIKKAGGDIQAFTKNGFGFKPVQESQGLTHIVNTGTEVADTEAVEANTAAIVENTVANEANTAAEAERVAATEAATVATVEHTAETKESTGVLGLLGEGFATFSTVAFVAAMGSAVYYLSQFKSTGNEVSSFVHGLEAQFSSLGENIVNGFKKKGVLGGVQESLKGFFRDFSASFQRGVENKKSEIAVENLTELDETENALLRAEAEHLRALSKDKRTDIAIRQEHLQEAQKIEKTILENEKNNAQERINLAIRVGDRNKQLTFDEALELEKGDLELAQRLALHGQKFSSEGYELYKKGIEAKIAYQAGANNEIVRLQADADNMQLRADVGLSKAEDRLNKARVQSALDASKLILDDSEASASAKIKANEDYIKNSIRLLKIQQQTELDNAGIGSSRGGKDSRTEAVTRKAIAQETENEINKVLANGLKNRDAIQKEIGAMLAKEQKERLDRSVAGEKALEDVYSNEENARLIALEEGRSKADKILADQYRDGEINEKEFNDRILKINQKYQVDKIQIEIDGQKKKLGAQAAAAALGFGDPKAIQTSADKLAKLQIQASDIATQNELDNIKKIQEAQKELASVKKQIADESISLIKELVDNGYKAEIEALEHQAQLIDENATIQKDAVSRALLSDKQKAQQTKLIDAEATAQKKQIAAEERKIKNKQAEFDKAASVAQIIEGTAVAIVNALKIPIYGEALAIAIGVLGGIQLAKVLATPIPKYKHGTTYHPGGLGTIGDAGSELVQYPNGYTFLSPNKATTLNMPEGTTVIPHLETVRTLERLGGTGSEAADNKEVAALLRENNWYQKQIASKNYKGNDNLVNDLITAQMILDRRTSYLR